MKAQHVYGLVRFSLTLFVIFFVGSTLWSINNVVLFFWHDPLRFFVIGVAVVASVVLTWQHALNAVKKNNKEYLIVVGIVGGVLLFMSIAFIFLDYSINQFGTFDALDQRIKTSVSIAVWISSVILLVCNFGLAVFYKHVYPHESMPFNIIAAELIAAVFCIFANAWGTSDAAFTLTQDRFSAISMAVTIDVMIFLMGAWYLIANDSATASITLWTTLAGIGMTTMLQITDGLLSGANFTTTQELKNIAQFAFPITFLLSVGLMSITFFVDYFRGGLSMVKRESGNRETRPDMSQRGERLQVDRPRPQFERQRPSESEDSRPARPERDEQDSGIAVETPPHHQLPPKAQSKPNRPQQGQGQSKHEYAEPGGLAEGDPDKLKALGYSNRAVRGKTQAQADHIIKNKIPPPPNERSGNFNPASAGQVKKTVNPELDNNSEQERETPRNKIISEEDVRNTLENTLNPSRPYRNGNNRESDYKPNP